MNRYLIWLFFTLLLIATPAVGQHWEGSIKLGGASTTFTGDLAAGTTHWDRRTGIAAAASFGLQLRYGFSPAVELAYTRMGASTPVIFLDIPATMRSDLTYLSSSLLLQYKLYTGGYVSPRVFAGPVFAYNASALITIEARDGLGVITEQDDSVESTDFGFSIGGGLDVELGSQMFTLELRYYMGQSDLTKPNPELGESDLRNRGMIIMAGVLF